MMNKKPLVDLAELVDLGPGGPTVTLEELRRAQAVLEEANVPPAMCPICGVSSYMVGLAGQPIGPGSEVRFFACGHIARFPG